MNNLRPIGSPLGVVFTAIALQIAFWSYLQPFAWFLLYPALFPAAILAGLYGGIVATLTGIQVYFCDPHPPWQRGTNENTNGLLR